MKPYIIIYIYILYRYVIGHITSKFMIGHSLGRMVWHARLIPVIMVELSEKQSF